MKNANNLSTQFISENSQIVVHAKTYHAESKQRGKAPMFARKKKILGGFTV